MEHSYLSTKSRLVAALLCGFLGTFGVHRFYVGKIGTGILMLATFGGFGIWYLFDLIMVVMGSFRDAEGRLVREWFEPDDQQLRSAPQVQELDDRMDRIDKQLTDLQGVMIDLTEKLDRREQSSR
jgi:TM2 domain-containing membrane protein YozV